MSDISTTGERLLVEENVRIETGVRMTLPDGVSLAADVYRPVKDGRYPVLLMRQPYGRDIASTVVYAQPTWFCRQGFIVVIQDVRGRGESEGEFHAFVNEAEDGVATIEWAAGLQGSNGKVGMYGFSYQASTQLLAAALRPPALKAIAPHMTAFDLYSGWFYRNGMLQLCTTLAWGAQMLREDARRKGANDWAQELDRGYANPGALNSSFPLNAVTPLVHPDHPNYVQEWLEHDVYDGYWEALDALKFAAEIADIPCFHLAGWYDFYLRGSMDGYRALAAHAPDKQRLIVGPWIHIPWGERQGDFGLGRDTRCAVDEALVAWMKYWCSDEDCGAGLTAAPVEYFSIGDNKWHSSATWPPVDCANRSYFLSSKGGANSIYGDGDLLRDATAVRGVADRYIYDPEVPVAGPGATPTGYRWGPVDLFPGQQGNNLLVYRTQPCTETLRFAGAPEAELFVRAHVVDTAFVVRLSLQREARTLFLCLGAARLEHGERQEDGSYRLLIKLDDIAFSLRPGERLCLDVSSSAFPLLARHPNTDTPINAVAEPGDMRRATQVVLHDAIHTSKLILSEVVS